MEKHSQVTDRQLSRGCGAPRLAAILASVALMAAACSSSVDSGTASEPADTSSAAGAAGDGELVEIDPAPVSDSDESPDVTAAVSEEAPDLVAGASTILTVTIDGTDIEYVAVVPEGFEAGDEAPVLLAMPPGLQSLGLTEGVVEGTYEAEAVRRGWVVVSPSAPNAVLYFRGSEALIPGFLEFVETWVIPEGGRFHLSGISNGGISAFRLAARNPDRFASMVVFPGLPQTTEDKAALEDLVDLPIKMFVGETDTGWLLTMEQTRDSLEEFGGDVLLEVFPGAGHIIGPLTDGVRIFDELDALR